METEYPRTANVNIRVNPQIKEEAEAVLDEIGLNLSDVFNLLLNQIRITHTIPFILHDDEVDPAFYPQIFEGLKKALEDREKGIKGYTVDEVDAMLNETIRRVENGEI